MSQRVEEERPDDGSINRHDDDIDPQGTQKHRPQGLVGEDGVPEKERLDEGKGHQGRDAIAERHSQ